MRLLRVNYDTYYVIQIIENALQAPLFRISIAPPQTIRESEMRSVRGLFYFFHRGLVNATALRRLSKWSKSVSEPHLSLIDRPKCSEGRFQNSVKLQLLEGFRRAPFSKV